MHKPSKTWKQKKNIIDKIHKHVCGHSSLTDYQILLERNNLWDDDVKQYIVSIIEKCNACRSTALPKPNRKVSISSLSKEFNENVCIDHLFLGDICVVHLMDHVTRYSAGLVVNDTKMDNAIMALEATWNSQFWFPQTIKGDTAFSIGSFMEYISNIGIKFELVPRGRHEKNPIESKHGIIRTTFLRLLNENKKTVKN